MMHKSFIFLILGALILSACEDTTYKSAVPTRPVQLVINTSAGMYVHFVRENIGAYVIVDHNGYHFNGQTLPLTETDYYGFAGVVVYVNNDRNYCAFDLCCPHCINPANPCTIDGYFAVCPICGEHYDLSFGYATPSKGFSKEALRKYTTSYAPPRLTIHD